MLFSFGCYYFFHLLYGIVSPQHSSAQGYPHHSRGKYRLNVVGLDAADGYDGYADAFGLHTADDVAIASSSVGFMN